MRGAPSGGPAGSDNRWQGYTHQELFDMLHSGPGARAAGLSADTWSGLSGALADIQQDISAGVNASGASWVGVAADSARGALGPLGEWAQQASAAAELMRVSTAMQGDLLSKARTDMPAPVPAPQPGDMSPMKQLMSAQLDSELIEAAQDAAAQRAFQVMTDYESGTVDNTSTLGEFGTPPALVVDTSPITGVPVRGSGVVESDQRGRTLRAAGRSDARARAGGATEEEPAVRQRGVTGARPAAASGEPTESTSESTSRSGAAARPTGTPGEAAPGGTTGTNAAEATRAAARATPVEPSPDTAASPLPEDSPPAGTSTIGASTTGADDTPVSRTSRSAVRDETPSPEPAAPADHPAAPTPAQSAPPQPAPTQAAPGGPATQPPQPAPTQAAPTQAPGGPAAQPAPPAHAGPTAGAQPTGAGPGPNGPNQPGSTVPASAGAGQPVAPAAPGGPEQAAAGAPVIPPSRGTSLVEDEILQSSYLVLGEDIYGEPQQYTQPVIGEPGRTR